MNDPEYKGRCAVCGIEGTFFRQKKSIREGYACSSCRSSLRYRHQAEMIMERYGRQGVYSLKEWVCLETAQGLSVLEPGFSGPLRKYLSRLPRYEQTAFWENVPSGQYHKGSGRLLRKGFPALFQSPIRCEDLMNLTYDNEQFDLVVTSDIFEHIRRPMQAFQEIARVLRIGGMHIFSIPVTHPMAKVTQYRVDTSGPNDIHIDPPHYHGDGRGGRSLVYTDFGGDLLTMLEEMQLPTEAISPNTGLPSVDKLITFVSTKVA